MYSLTVRLALAFALFIGFNYAAPHIEKYVESLMHTTKTDALNENPHFPATSPPDKDKDGELPSNEHAPAVPARPAANPGPIQSQDDPEKAPVPTPDAKPNAPEPSPPDPPDSSQPEPSPNAPETKPTPATGTENNRE